MKKDEMVTDNILCLTGTLSDKGFKREYRVDSVNVDLWGDSNSRLTIEIDVSLIDGNKYYHPDECKDDIDNIPSFSIEVDANDIKRDSKVLIDFNSPKYLNSSSYNIAMFDSDFFPVNNALLMIDVVSEILEISGESEGGELIKLRATGLVFPDEQ